MRKAISIHFVEKRDEESQNLQCVDKANNIWTTAYWVIGKDTQRDLIGGAVYVHRGQKIASHIGGIIQEIYHEEGSDAKRRVVKFQEKPEMCGIFAGQKGWGNERKVVWNKTRAKNEEPDTQ